MADAIQDGPDTTRPDEASGTKPNGSLKKKFIIIGIIVAVQSALMLVAGQFVIKPMMVGGKGDVAVAQDKEVGRGSILVLENIVVNLNAPEATRYLKVSVGLEVENEKAATEVEDRRPVLRDIVISSLSGRPVEHVITAQGKDEIREQLKTRFGSSLQEGQLMNVYFSEFVVQ